jgi:hypothetical protein
MSFFITSITSFNASFVQRPLVLFFPNSNQLCEHKCHDCVEDGVIYGCDGKFVKSFNVPWYIFSPNHVLHHMVYIVWPTKMWCY